MHPDGSSQLSPCQCSTGLASSGASTDFRPADDSVSDAQPISLTGPGATLRAKRRRHHLRAEANAEHRLVCRKARRNCCDLVGNERIGVPLVDTNRAAKHDQQIRCEQRLRVERLDPGVMITNAIAARGDQRTEQAKILKRDVTNRQARFGHRASAS